MSAVLTEPVPDMEPQHLIHGESGIDFSQFRNADEITEGVLAYLKGITLRGRLPLLESGLFDSARAARARRAKPRRAIDAAPTIEEKA